MKIYNTHDLKTMRTHMRRRRGHHALVTEGVINRLMGEHHSVSMATTKQGEDRQVL